MSFQELFFENFWVKFGDPSYTGFWDIVHAEKQTDKRSKNSTPATAVGVGKYHGSS